MIGAVGLAQGQAAGLVGADQRVEHECFLGWRLLRGLPAVHGVSQPRP